MSDNIAPLKSSREACISERVIIGQRACRQRALAVLGAHRHLPGSGLADARDWRMSCAVIIGNDYSDYCGGDLI